MEAIRIDEVELIGEDGGRIVVSADHWAKDPDKAGVALRIMDGDDRAFVRLDDEEAHQLRSMIDAQIPGRKHGDKGISFEDAEGATLRIVPSNMGEPYREGLHVSFGKEMEPGVRVFIRDDEALRLAVTIDRLLPQPGLGPRM